VSEQFLNGTSAQFRLYSASNGKLDRRLKPKAAIWDLAKLEIAPFDPPTPKTPP